MLNWKKEIFLITLGLLSVIAQSPNMRLPRAIIPKHYDLHLETAVHDGGIRSYGGEVNIDLEVFEATNYVVLHHRGLNLTNVSLVNIVTSSNLSIQSPIYDNVTEFLTIQSDIQLNVGDALRLKIEFTGKLNTGTSGFYRSQYQVRGENFPR